MSKIKKIYKYNTNTWDSGVPIGANDTKVKITDSSMNVGYAAATDLDTNDTSDSFTSNAVVVQQGDTETSAWKKFNRFRARVVNSLGSFMNKNISTTYTTTNATNTIYTANVLNSYMNNVIGVNGLTAPEVNDTNRSIYSSIFYIANRHPYFDDQPVYFYGFSIAANSNATLYTVARTGASTYFGTIFFCGTDTYYGIAKFSFKASDGTYSTLFKMYGNGNSNMTSKITASTVKVTKTVSGTTYTRYYLKIANTISASFYCYLIGNGQFSDSKPYSNYPAPS